MSARVSIAVVVDELTERVTVEETREQLAELDEAIAEAERSEGIPWEQVRAELFGTK